MNTSEKDTSTLYTELMSSPDLERFLKDNETCISCRKSGEVLREFLDGYPNSKADIARRTGISDVYLYQIMAGKRSPSRDKLITMCIVLSTPLEDTQKLLKGCGESELYVKNRRDAILIKCISDGQSLAETNVLLNRASEKEL